MPGMKKPLDWLVLLRAPQARQTRAVQQTEEKLKTKAKFTLSLLVDAFQIFAVVYPLDLVSVRVVKALM